MTTRRTEWLRVCLGIVVLVLMGGARILIAQATVPTYANPNADPEARITDLLAHMTIDEKIHALSTDPSVPRLGIVGTGHVEGLHGLALGGPGHWEGRLNQAVVLTTQFPQSRGLGQTWDPALIQQAAAQEALETRFAWQKYRRGGLVVRAPNADLSRDPRWGRSEESYGEDPFLVGTLATAFTRGLQGNDPHVWETASLLKHFLANSNEDNRDGSSSNFDTRLFHEYYAVPFRMAIEDGHANAMMTSYNAWNGVPMAANPVLRSVVMADWHFDGILCTDAGALTNMVTHHHTYADLPTAAAAAIHAGINQFLDKYDAPVHEALAQGLITEADIDRNLRGVYRVMLRLGVFDSDDHSPYASIGVGSGIEGDPWNAASARALVRKVTDESIVLLKNDHNTLPLDAAKTQSIAVIGPWADTVALDWYSGTPPRVVTPLEGIRLRVPNAKVSFSDGKDAAAAAALAAKSQMAIVIVGNHPTCNAGWNVCASPSEGKEAIDRKSLTLEDEALVERVLAANPNTIVVLQTSFPYTTNWTQEHAPAIVQITHNSEEQGNALADVLFGSYDPAGRLTQTWPASLDQLPPMMDYDLRHGRTYLYSKQKPLYPFGFGLSYTRFSYSDLRVEQHGDMVHIHVSVANTGGKDGDEVVQIYAAHQGSAVSRPLEELVAFKRVPIERGQTQSVEFDVPLSRLAYWDEASKRFVVERDRVEFRAAASSADIRLRKVIAIEPEANALITGR
ncbi:glycoside hydrolase family 3 C-terminal domain-containing protein [Granulicella sp. 5B5]|uniref:glycoside hydrolase family 3 C-terminal domain-containing protein n=1 Tax=Granulicella sp. 5B5 TaxID=1617967 RepID=UPI0021020B4D|nr:glycoside hydrolase family 3 C-terminal domain-containing protein [Granulicella sp. 5B5]